MYLGSEQQKVKLEYRQSFLMVSPFFVYILGLNRLLYSIVVTSKRAKSVKIQQRGVCGGEYKFSMLILTVSFHELSHFCFEHGFHCSAVQGKLQRKKLDKIKFI